MRKQDYATLADTLRRRLFAARYTDRSGMTEGAALAVLLVIRESADRLSVDRDAFLKACGIEHEQ